MTLYSAKIVDLGKIVTGKTPSTKNKENFGGNIPFITPVDMSYNRNVFSTERYVSSKGTESVKGCILPPKTVCVSCIGSDMGKSVITTRTSVTNQQINSVIVNEEHNYMYVYYLMRTLENTIKSLGKNGTAVPILSKSKFSDIDIQVHDLESQCRIAKILSAYDNLIENNQKQIKLLEEAAQRLYKEWFVNLRFPEYENTPIIDGVPQGWEEYAIAELCERINAGGTPSRRNKNYWDNATIKWYKTQELQDCWLIDSDEKISVEGQSNSSAKFFPENTILMAIYASPTLGRLGVLDSAATCNQAALCLKADETKISWQWLYEKLYELRDHYNGIARGAGQQNISGEVVKQTIVLCPTKRIVDKYTQIVAPLFEMRRILQKQNIRLTEARDRLLPKLMSGELEV
ncbi:MAG: restriction endonuclease subunit S [Clostridia bacterium]|nr:restriction endonuclease subunit S [Clostridia bacterium]